MNRFSDDLNHYAQARGYTGGQLARLAGLPRRTVANWLTGHIHQPRYVEDVIKLAQALHLSRAETDTLLRQAGFPSLIELFQQEQKAEVLDLLSGFKQHVPFQLPNIIPYFVGRSAELDFIHNALQGNQGICGLYGMGGIGKTTLAIAYAHQYASAYPDGILWLSGHNLETHQATIAIALAYGFDLESLDNMALRTSAIRSLLAQKEGLIIVDNLRDSHMLKQIIPDGKCSVLVTSRKQNISALIGLPTCHLKPFDDKDALLLLESIIGHEQVTLFREDSQRIVSLLGYLPLAIAIVGARLKSEPGWTVQQFSERLEQETNRLNLLKYDDLNVKLMLDVSMAYLSGEERQTLAILSIFESNPFTHTLAQVVTDNQNIGDVLRSLCSLSLLQYSHDDTYQVHALISDFASQLLDDKSAAHQRLITHFADFMGKQPSYAMLDKHYPHLQTAIRHADPSQKAVLLIGLYDYWRVQGVVVEKQLLYQSVLSDLSDTTYHAIQVLLARIALQIGDYARAEDHLNRAKATSQASQSFAHVYNLLGTLYMYRGDDLKSRRVLQDALTIAQKSGDMQTANVCKMNIGVTHYLQGEYAQALTYYQDCLHSFEHLTTTERNTALISGAESIIHMVIGVVNAQLGNFDTAEHAYHDSLERAELLDYKERMAAIYYNLSELAAMQGDSSLAMTHARTSLAHAEAVNNQGITVKTQIGLARYAICLQDISYAQATIANALDSALCLDNLSLIRYAHLVKGELNLALAQMAIAEQVFKIALSITPTRPIGTIEAQFGLARVAYQNGNEAKGHHHANNALELAKRIQSVKRHKIHNWLMAL